MRKKLDKVQLAAFEEIYQRHHMKERSRRIADTLVYRISEMSELLSLPRRRNVVKSVTWRAKSPKSIMQKLIAKGKPVDLSSSVSNINDLVGIRVICPYLDDVYLVARTIKSIPGIKVIGEKNYVEKPKKSGYRSIHLIVDVSDYDRDIKRAEIQIRSVAMNIWAGMDHKLCYKSDKDSLELLKRKFKQLAEILFSVDWKICYLRMQSGRM